MNKYKVLITSQIDGEFEGFDDEILFKLMDGSYWLQDEYHYWYHYAYCPEAKILQMGNRLYIQVDGQDEIVPVREISGVIENKINGVFKGWSGDSTYELVNGQVWQQARYKYKYKYAYRPDVLIYKLGGHHVMQVAGTSVKVRRIK